MSSKRRLQILYSSIMSRDITLVSHQEDDSFDYGTTIQEVQKSIDSLHLSSSEQKLTYPVDSYQVHVLVEKGIVYLCITECTNAHYTPFKFLHQVRQLFWEQPSLVSRSYRAGEDELDRDFRPVLMNVMVEFNMGRADQIFQVEEQIEDVKRIMLRNVESVIDRGERLDDLLSKTEELESQGQEFRRQARAVQAQAKCRHLKLWLIIGAICVVILTVIVLYATGIIKS